MRDPLAVADWIRMRRVGHSQEAIAKRAGCCRSTVKSALLRNELDMGNLQSIERWIYDRTKISTKPSPGAAFTRYSLLRSEALLPARGKSVWSMDRARDLLADLKAVGFTQAQMRGTNHVALKPDLYFLPDAAQLLDLMNRNGWRARDLSVSARRWLVIFGTVQLPDSLRALARKRHRGGREES